MITITNIKVPVKSNGYAAHVEIAESKKKSPATGFVSIPRTPAGDALFNALKGTEFFSGLELSLERKANYLVRGRINSQDEADLFVEQAEEAMVEAINGLPIVEAARKPRSAKAQAETVAEAVVETVAETVEADDMVEVVEVVEAEA